MDELLDSAPCGYLSFTDAGLIVDVNTTLLQLLNYAPGELANQKFESILTVSSRIFFQTHFFPLLKLHNSASEIYFSLRSKDKHEIPVLVNAIRRQQGGHFVNVCIFIVVLQRQKYENEILQAKRAAEVALRSNQESIAVQQALEQYTQELDRKVSQLEQKNREQLRVTQILFHDLWEPLRKIMNFTDLIVQDGHVSANSPLYALLDRIRTAASSIGTLLRALREYMAVDTQNEALTPVNLNDVLADANRIFADKGVTYEITSTSLPTIEGYYQQLLMLFVQLIDNSIQFCKPNQVPKIFITDSLVQHNQYRVSKDRYRYTDFVKIDFQDNSRGFSNEHSSTIFGLLTKLDRTSPGLGIGLAICQKVVENHFGSITARSQGGEGATFTVLLPLRQVPSPVTTQEQTEPAESESLASGDQYSKSGNGDQ